MTAASHTNNSSIIGTVTRLISSEPHDAAANENGWGSVVRVCGLWFVVCGLWFVVCGLWFVVCGLWFVVCGLWFVVFGLWFVVSCLWFVDLGLCKLWDMGCGLGCGMWFETCAMRVPYI